jgi:hypothetical protein
MQAVVMVRATRYGHKDVCGTGAAKRSRITVLRSSLLFAAALLSAAAALAADRPVSRPWVVLRLDSLGVPAFPASFLNAGMSLMTVHLIDDNHLLLTFSTRELVPRIPDDPPDDDDRMVAAEIVELPSGKIQASTRWHLHDHGQYLWKLGGGRFLVRSGNSIFAVTPLASPAADAFQRIAFPHGEGRVVAEFSSPDDSLAVIESLRSKPKPPVSQMPTPQGDPAPQTDKPLVEVDFFRIQGGQSRGASLLVDPAGSVLARGLLDVPIDSDGYLFAEEGSRGRWNVSFNDFTGKARKIGSLDSSCEPILQLVSPFQFVAFTCQGSSDRLKLESFGLDGHETWEEPLALARPPRFVFAPRAGRFAVNRIQSAVPAAEVLASMPDDATQEVRVYQTESGDLLLKTPCSPILRDSENFDLSEDGLVAAVIHNGAVEVYKLPAPSARDLADLKLAQGFAPPRENGAATVPVKLARLVSHDAENSATASESAADSPASSPSQPAASRPSATMTRASLSTSGATPESSSAPPEKPGNSVAESRTPVSGSGSDSTTDVTESRRKPPTLLEPGETAQYGGSGAETPH